MLDFDRILVAYRDRQTQVVDQIMEELDATPEERARLRLVAQLVQSVVHTFGTLDGDRAAFEAAGFVERRAPSPLPLVPGPGDILNLSMRALVDSGSLTAWQARCININLGLKRTILIFGGSGSGKSTLLNGLIGLLPGNQRLVVVDEEEGRLPVLSERPSTVQLAGTSARTRPEAFREAARSRPDWIVVQELSPADGPSFLDCLQGSCGGLATVTEEEPEPTLASWIVEDRKRTQGLARLKPLLLRLKQDEDGRPYLVDLLEATVKDGEVVVTSHSSLA